MVLIDFWKFHPDIFAEDLPILTKNAYFANGLVKNHQLEIAGPYQRGTRMSMELSEKIITPI